MKILVTGAAGYIGSVLVGELLDAGHGVLAYDNLACGADSLARYADRPGFEFVFGDARSEGDMRKALSRVDAAIPLAAVVGMPACDRDPAAARAINVDAIRMLVEIRPASWQRIVFPNTNSGYGSVTPEETEARPHYDAREEYSMSVRTDRATSYCTEETALNPISLYGRLKCEAETIVLDAPNTVVLRLATVFGMSPRMRRDLLVNDFVWRGLRDRRIEVYEGHAMRNYVHVRDVARAFRKIVEELQYGPLASGRLYNFGNDSLNLSKWDLAKKIGEATSCAVADATGSDPDKRNYIVSSGKLTVAGVQATIGLDEGIREMIAGYRTMPEFYA